MFVDVKTEKRQQTNGCHLSPLLSAMQLNREETPSAVWEKTCFNPSRGGLSKISPTPFGNIVEHDWPLVCARRTLW